MNDAGSSQARRQPACERNAPPAFLLGFGDALRALDRAADIPAAAARLLGAYLDASRACYAELDGDGAPRPPPAAGEYARAPPRASAQAARELDAAAVRLCGRGAVAVADTAADARLGPREREACKAAGAAALMATTLRAPTRPDAYFGVFDAHPREWTPDETALLQDAAVRTRDEIGRARAQAALRESERRYRALFGAMGEALCVLEVLPGADGEPACRIVETNPAFDRAFAPDARAGAADPGRDPYWLRLYMEVAATGVERRFSAHLPAGGRWFDVHAFRVGDPDERKVAVLFTDVTRSRAAEHVLRWNQQRQQALLEFGDAARATTDPRLIVAMAARLLGRRLGADRVGYAEIDRERGLFTVVDAWCADPDAPAFDGSFALEWIGRQVLRGLREGRVVVVDDVATDPRLSADERSGYACAQVGAFIAAPALRRARLRAVLFVHHRQARAWGEEERELVSEFGLRTWAELDRARAEDALRSSEERFRQFAEASSDILWIRDARTLRFEYVSPAFERIYGARAQDVLGTGLSNSSGLIVDEDRQRVVANLQRIAHGERVTQGFRIVRADTGRQRWLLDTGFPLLAADGTVQRIGGIRRDVTAEKETADRLRVLVAELQHRTRNLIAVVRALADRTLQDHAGDGGFARIFGERLDALARAQGLLSRLDGERRVSFDALLEAELNAHGAFARDRDRVQVQGPAGVRLRSRSVQTLALALHELATNALKYGALSVPDGRLRIHWQVQREADGRDWLHLDWRETGLRLPADAAPRQGYGRELIERALPFQLGARTGFRLTVEGVHCTLAVPIEQGEAPPGDAA